MDFLHTKITESISYFFFLIIRGGYFNGIFLMFSGRIPRGFYNDIRGYFFVKITKNNSEEILEKLLKHSLEKITE